MGARVDYFNVTLIPRNPLMRYLLTGGTGFIGAALCRRLAAGGAVLTVLTREPARMAARLPPGTRGIRQLGELGVGGGRGILTPAAQGGTEDTR
jgi:uncharacterized protein YbjT (DUF2867 family)